MDFIFFNGERMEGGWRRRRRKEEDEEEGGWKMEDGGWMDGAGEDEIEREKPRGIGLDFLRGPSFCDLYDLGFYI